MRETALKMGVLGGLLWVALGCGDEITLGGQCPNPATGKATVMGGAAPIYGTSCAPCDRPIELDARGCPKLVTFESCGGDICIGSARISAGRDEDAGEDDGGAEAEDGGAD